VFETRNLIENALQGAIYDRLCSVVYCALNTALNSFHDPKALRKEWRKLGSNGVARILIVAVSCEDSYSPDGIRLESWIARRLRPFDEDGLVPIVGEWLEGKLLSSHISENPDEEDLKVRRLRSLLATVSDTSQRRST